MTPCAPATFTGPLKIDQQSFEVNPTNYNADLHAYVDSSGKLHVGLGTVAFLGPNRSGTAQLQNSETLTVKGGQCLDGSSDEPKAPVNLGCHFVNEGAQVLLVYDKPGDHQPSRHPSPKVVFVYYAGSGLLVEPYLVTQVFTKQ